MTPEPNSAPLSAHDHGNCELCSHIDAQLAALEQAMRAFAERHSLVKKKDGTTVYSASGQAALAWAETIRNLYARVDDSQYAAPLATASNNEVIR